MNRQLAKQLAESKRLTTDQVFKQIEENAKQGRFLAFFDHGSLSNETVNALLDAGFSVQQHTPPLSPYTDWVIGWA
jgi:hypothetical protein